MLVQISAGTGPIECGIAVDKIFRALVEETTNAKLPKSFTIADGATFKNIQIIKVVKMDPQYGSKQDAFRSILFETDDKSFYELSGKSICWHCESPVRIGHKRKNWYVNVTIIPDVEDISFDDDELQIEFFHSGGKGGQNVNKVETGVRLIHQPTGISVESTVERTQMANRRDAYNKLCDIFKQMKQDAINNQKNAAWEAHYDLERGNPVRTYNGMNAKRKK